MTRLLESSVKRGTEGTTFRALESYVGAFTDPTSLPNLVTWYDASVAGDFTFSSGTVVSQWRDKSGAARHLVPPGTGPNRAGTLNSKNVVHFDNSMLEWTGAAAMAGTTAHFFMVAKFTGGDAHGRVVSLKGSGGLADYEGPGGVAMDPEGAVWPSGYRNGTQLSTGSNHSGEWNVVDWSFDGTNSRLTVDSVAASPAASTGTWEATIVALGGRAGPHDTLAICDIAEVFFYSDVKAGTDITNLRQYLANKWLPAAPTVPAAPVLSATPGDTQVVLTWTAPASTGGAITNYLVETSATGTSGWSTVTTLNALTYTHTGRTNGTPYYYRVSATNPLGYGPVSNTASATPNATGWEYDFGILGAPTGWTKAAGTGNLVVTSGALTSDTTFFAMQAREDVPVTTNKFTIKAEMVFVSGDGGGDTFWFLGASDYSTYRGFVLMPDGSVQQVYQSGGSTTGSGAWWTPLGGVPAYGVPFIVEIHYNAGVYTLAVGGTVIRSGTFSTGTETGFYGGISLNAKSGVRKWTYADE